MGVNELMEALIERTRDTTIDLRYTHGKWYVMTSLGNQMVVVPDSGALTAEESLQKAIDRWDTRGIGRPFIVAQ